jgi:hypothetical protein
VTAAGDSVNLQDQSCTGPENNRPATAWWKKFWADLRRRASLGRPAADPAADAGRQQAAQGKNGAAASSSGSGSSRLADPDTMEIIAPPQPAVPLAQLPVDKFVAGEEHKPHG